MTTLISYKNIAEFYFYAHSKTLQDKRISNSAKNTYYVFIMLLLKYGFCFMTNQYIADYLNISVKNVERHMEELERANYIFRETFFNGHQMERKIWDYDWYQIQKENNETIRPKEIRAARPPEMSVNKPTEMGVPSKMAVGGVPSKMRVDLPSKMGEVKETLFKEEDIKEKKEKEKKGKVPRKAPLPASPDGDVLSSFFLDCRKEQRRKTGIVDDAYLPKGYANWAHACDKLLKKASMEQIKKYMIWATNHEFWHKVIKCPSKLESHFDERYEEMLEDEMKNARNKPKESPNSKYANSIAPGPSYENITREKMATREEEDRILRETKERMAKNLPLLYPK